MVACGDPKAETFSGDPVAIYRNGIKEDQTPDYLSGTGFYQECFQKLQSIRFTAPSYWLESLELPTWK